jgi:Tfp pilus assembly protein PilX
MITVLLVMLMMTGLGIAAITATGLENRMAGSMASIEGAAAAGESLTGVGVNIIQQTLDPDGGAGTVPASFLSNATPAGPIPQTNATILATEIMGGADNSSDFADGTGSVPNLVQNVGPYSVRGDLDRLFLKGIAGSGMMQFAGYEGTGNSIVGSSNIYYRIDLVARNTATGISSRVVAVYGCTTHGESCQK